MKKIAIVLSGGGMNCVYSAGVMYALAKKFVFTTPYLLISASGSAGTSSYYVSGQFESIKKIWTQLLCTNKFINPFRFWKIMDINYLIDDVFKKQEPLDFEKIKKSEILYLISSTNIETGDIKYFSSKDGFDIFETMRITKSLPIFFNKKFNINGENFGDGISSSVYPKILKARELGADKIIAIDTERSNIYIEIWKNLYLFFKSKTFKENFYKYKQMKKNYLYDKNVLFLKPNKKLFTGLLTNNKNKLLKDFYQGIEDTVSKKELKDLLMSVPDHA